MFYETGIYCLKIHKISWFIYVFVCFSFGDTCETAQFAEWSISQQALPTLMKVLRKKYTILF